MLAIRLIQNENERDLLGSIRVGQIANTIVHVNEQILITQLIKNEDYGVH